jgi:hypothetical protein
MINVMRSDSIRLLSRTSQEGRASTVIDNRPFKDNYYQVRASLGLTPADSLLYAPVTVVVEGDTEVLALPALLLKLAEAGVQGFERVRHLLEQVHFLDGIGDNFAHMCKLARSQKAKPVVFLDGDKRRHLPQFNIPDDVPKVLLDEGKEFEELVPHEIYFQAVAELVGDETGQVTKEGFANWLEGANLHPKMVFTKRVDRWMGELGLPEPNKGKVMQLAVERVEVNAVIAGPLRELLSRIEEQLPE